MGEGHQKQRDFKIGLFSSDWNGMLEDFQPKAEACRNMPKQNLLELPAPEHFPGAALRI
jgi:hypothetical protein